MLLRTYNILMRFSTPVLCAYLQKRTKAGKEDVQRAAERRGQAALPRPPGKLVWFHAASVGESLSLLSLIEHTLKDHPALNVLVTTGTVTSAKLMAARLPKRALHQYVPVDHPVWVERFLNHWHPDLALWAESEFWPNLLMAVQKRRIPAVLLNARMSKESFRTWSFLKGMIRSLLGTFDLCLAQNVAEGERLSLLGAKNVRVSANLKYAAAPLPFETAALMALEDAAGHRPRVLWASTHAGEETLAAKQHQALSAKHKGLLTVIVPRHPVRGAEIAATLKAEGLAVAQRSLQENITDQTQIYIADTLGELGLFYRFCKNVVMGGSFADIGGHNPIEPAQTGCIIFFGPMTYNFLSIMEDLRAAQAVVEVEGEAALLEKLEAVLHGPKTFEGIARAALALTTEKSNVVEMVMAEIAPYLEVLRDTPRRQEAS